MPGRRIYVETSVWSFAFAEDVPDYRADTLAFFERARGMAFDVYISEMVLEEIERANEPLRAKLLNLVEAIRPKVLSVSAATDQLSGAFLREGVVPASKPEDADHVAVAFCEGMDVLVSWNFRHIVSVRRAERFTAVALLEGYTHPLRIVTPAQVLYDERTDAT